LGEYCLVGSGGKIVWIDTVWLSIGG
jgi:hypothetical protein